MAQLQPSQNLSLQSGFMTAGAVAESRIPLDAVTESLNFHFDRIGAATLRKGTTLLGDSGVLSGNLLGLYEFRDSGSGTNNRIVAVNGTVLYYLSGSTWTSKRTGLTTGNKARFTTFLDFLWMVNGVDATAIWDGASGNSFLTTGNAASAPIGKFIENFRSRVWIAGNATYPDRLYYSSLPSAVTTPVVLWDTNVNTGQWIDISPSDGENITALKRTQASLLVFKTNHIYRVYTIDETEPDPKINVGTPSAESIVEAKDGLYFYHSSGFYKYSGGQPDEISKPIIDIVNNITLANQSKVTGWLETDGDHIVWSVGDVTINGVTYNNLEVRYTISTQTWTHYMKPTQVLCASRYNDGTNVFQLVGDTAGSVLKVDTGLTDNGTPISYSLVHRWTTVDGTLTTEKNITKMLFHHQGGASGKIAYQREDDILNNWTKIFGQLSKSLTSFNNANIKGRKLRFRIFGSSTGEPFIYNGFEINDGTTNIING